MDSYITLSTLDWITFALVGVITILCMIYGEYKKRKLPELINNSDEKVTPNVLELLLMGRQLTLPLFVATLVATWYGGIFGVTAISYEKGIYNFVTQGVFWYITYLIFAFYLVDKIRKYKSITLPDMVEEMIGPLSGKLSAWFNFFNLLPIAYAISIGLLLQAMFGGNLNTQITIGVMIVVTYSFVGGFRAVVYSDLAQFIFMIVAVVTVIFFAVTKLGSWDYLMANLPASHFDPTGGESIPTLMVWGFIALSTLVDPNFYQRCFAAKTTRVAKLGILISTLIWFGFDICTTLGGLYAKAYNPNLDPSQAYLIFFMEILPDGFKGLVLGGVAATILSTLDSFLFLGATTVTYDILPHRYRNSSFSHHFGILVVGILAIFISFYFEGNVKSAWKTLGSLSAGCLLMPVMLAHLFPKKITDIQFFTSSLLGAISIIIQKIMEAVGYTISLDELYTGLFTTGLFLFLFYISRKLKKIKNNYA